MEPKIYDCPGCEATNQSTMDLCDSCQGINEPEPLPTRNITPDCICDGCQ